MNYISGTKTIKTPLRRSRCYGTPVVCDLMPAGMQASRQSSCHTQQASRLLNATKEKPPLRYAPLKNPCLRNNLPRGTSKMFFRFGTNRVFSFGLIGIPKGCDGADAGLCLDACIQAEAWRRNIMGGSPNQGKGVFLVFVKVICGICDLCVTTKRFFRFFHVVGFSGFWFILFQI